MKTWAFGLVLLAFTLGGAAGVRADGDSPLTAEDREILRWLDGLEAPDLLGRAPGTRADLEATAKTALAEARRAVDPLEEPLEYIKRRRGLRLRLELAVLARACAANELESLAHELLLAADGVDDPRRWGAPLLAMIQSEAADFAFQRLLADFERPSVPRPRLLAACERYAKQHAETRHSGWVAEAIDILRVMIAEDAAGVPADPVERRIYELRELGNCTVLDGWPMLFEAPYGGHPTQADALRDVGPAAVPRLIELLGDRRFTRQLQYGRVWQVEDVVRYGECALQVLEAIAGRRFRGINPAESQALARAWWAKNEGKGERAILDEIVRAGGYAAYESLPRLIAVDPDAALAALREGARKRESAPYRDHLVRAAARIPGDRPVPFLLEELRHGPPRARIAAARALRDRGRKANPD